MKIQKFLVNVRIELDDFIALKTKTFCYSHNQELYKHKETGKQKGI